MATAAKNITQARVPMSATREGKVGFMECIAITASYFLVVISFPISIFLIIKIVTEYERAVIFRLGRLRTGRARGPGMFFVLPCIDEYVKVDLRTVTFNVPPQEVLTKDSCTVSVDAVVYACVVDPLKCITRVADYYYSSRLLAATTLRSMLGSKSLSEVLSERESIAHDMQVSLDLATEPWGIKVERVELKDVSLPVQMQRVMAAEAESTREARAKLIDAEGELNAARALKEASDILGQSPGALQLRYLQTLNTISVERNSTIVFPLPMDLITPFIK